VAGKCATGWSIVVASIVVAGAARVRGDELTATPADNAVADVKVATVARRWGFRSPIHVLANVATVNGGALPQRPAGGRDPSGISAAPNSSGMSAALVDTAPTDSVGDAASIGNADAGSVRHEADELVVPEVSPRFADLFEPRSYRYTGGVYDNEPFPYRLFVPVTRPGEKYPLIVWLHGHGEAGSDNVMHLAWLGERMMLPPWRRERFPFSVLCVPCPIENDYWNGYPTGTPEEKRSGDAILSDVLQDFPVDQNRIYLSGVSSGGSGCWHYALQFPNRFAAVAPLAGGRVAGDYARLVDVPVWCFHSTHDTGSPVDGARQNVAELRAAGGQVKLTEIDTVSHDCWTAAFGKHQLLDWMLAQRRGSPAVMDIRPWQQRFADGVDEALAGWTWPQLAGQGTVIVLLAAGLLGLLKQVQSARLRWKSPTAADVSTETSGCPETQQTKVEDCR